MCEQTSFKIISAQINLLKVLQNNCKIKTHPLAKCPKGVFQEIFIITSYSTRITQPLQLNEVEILNQNIIAPKHPTYENSLTHIEVWNGIDCNLRFLFKNGDITKTDSRNLTESIWVSNPLP